MKLRYSATASLVQQLTWCRHRLWRWRRLAFLPMLVAAGCALVHPKPNDACNEGDGICQGPGAAIMCRSGHYARTDCAGPAGCGMQPDRTVKCDQSRGAHEGTACTLEYEGRGQCIPEEDAYLRCVGGWWKREACPENSSCQRSELGVACVARPPVE